MVLTKSQVKLEFGQTAPDFRLQGVNGKEYSLGNFADREGLLVVFMCNHCPYVKAKIGAIVELHQKFKDRLGILGINSNDPEYPGEGMGLMKEFAEERHIQFPYVLDDTQAVARSYGATCTPDPFLFDKERKLAYHGRIDDALEPGDEVHELTLENNIRKMLAGEQIEKQFDPSVGCSIKWIE